MPTTDLRAYLTAHNLTIKTVSDLTHIPYHTLQNWLAPENAKSHRAPPEWAIYLALEKLKSHEA